MCVALVIRHAKRMRGIIFTSMDCRAAPRYLINDKIFGKNY